MDLRYCLREPHMFSIGFKSGDSGGVFHHVMLFTFEKVLNIFASMLWIVVLLKPMPFWKVLSQEWHERRFKNFCVFWAFIIPVNITTLVVPFMEIPPYVHFCRVFGCYFKKRGSFFLLKHNLPWWSNCMVHSSVKTTLLNFSLLAICCWHHSFRLSLFTSLISWQ